MDSLSIFVTLATTKVNQYGGLCSEIIVHSLKNSNYYSK